MARCNIHELEYPCSDGCPECKRVAPTLTSREKKALRDLYDKAYGKKVYLCGCCGRECYWCRGYP